LYAGSNTLEPKADAAIETALKGGVLDPPANKGIELMGTAPVSNAIIRLALPMIAGMLAQSIYNMTDLFFIGKTGDPNMIAAVSLVYPLFMLSQGLGNIFAVGGSSYISRMLGAKQDDEARHTSAVSFYSAFCIGLVLAVTLFIFKKPVLRLIGASSSIITYTNDYFSVINVFIPVAATGAVLSGLMRSEGATDRAMRAMLIGIVLNMVLDPVFILWLRLGTAGAAWATVAGQTASFVYGIFYFLSKKTLLSVKPSDYKSNKTMWFQVLSIGIAAGLHSIVMAVSSILGNRIAASYGDFVIAGYGLQIKISSMFFSLIFALAQGYQPFAGFNYGAKNYDRLRKGFKITIVYAVSLGIMGSVILYFFGRAVLKFFINDAPIIEAGRTMMNAFIFGLPFTGLQITLMTTFQALGKSVQAMIITLGRNLLCFVPLLFLLNHFFAFNGFIWARPAADILTTGIAVIFSRVLFRIMRGEMT
jgi:putative MATE family efflux protein